MSRCPDSRPSHWRSFCSRRRRPPPRARRRSPGSSPGRSLSRTWPEPTRRRWRSTSRRASSSTRGISDLPLIPASNEKLAVTYASLLALGPSFRFSTDVLGEGELDGTLWRGDVVLKGYGDPTLSTLDLLSLASQLRSQGIRRVTGQVIGDESFFDAKRMAPGWKSYFFLNESPALSALTVDRGRYKGRATRQPALAAALSFRAALLRAGISVAGRALTGTADSAAVPLATIESVPLAGVLRFMDHESDNFTAEMLLKQLGAGIGLQGTTAAGAQAVLQLLQEQQIPLDRRADRRRLRPVPPRPADDRGRGRDAPLELARRGSPRAPDRRAAGRRAERHARLPHARDRRRGARAREDRHAERSLRARPATCAAATRSRSSRTGPGCRSTGRGWPRISSRQC